MKKLAALAVLAMSFTFANAGDAPKQAPAPAKAAADCKGECKTVVVARPATLRERRSLVVLQPVTVQEVKKVEVKKTEVKKSDCDCGSTCTTARKPLLGRRVRTVAVADCCK